MAQDTQAAQSYAKAIYELAVAGSSQAKWTETLEFAAAVAVDPLMTAMITDASVGRERQTAAFLKVCEGRLDAAAQNLVRLLGENSRLGLLPEIARQYEALRMEGEQRVEARVVSAKPLSAAESERIASALSKRLGKTVTVVPEVDESLIGGAVIHAGDLVIDGSIRGGLAGLAAAMGR
jgi:F-type H+-transporting ATPase subunit delta